MDNLCSICLSEDRKLSCKDDLISVLQYLTPELYDLIPSLNICLECESLLKKCSSLREQILKAHAVRVGVNIKHEIDVEVEPLPDNQKSLSNLETKHSSGYDYVFNRTHTHVISASSRKKDLHNIKRTIINKTINPKDIAGCSTSSSMNNAGTSSSENVEVFIETEPVECDVIIKSEPDSDDNPDTDNSDDNFDKSDDEVSSKRKRGVKRSLPTLEVLKNKLKAAIDYTKEDFESIDMAKSVKTAPNMPESSDDVNNSILSMDIDSISHRLGKNMESKDFVSNNFINSLRSQEFPFVKVKPREFILPSEEEIFQYFNEAMKKALICEDDVDNVTISILSHADTEKRRQSQAAKSYLYASSKFKCLKCLFGYPTQKEFEEHLKNKHVQEDKLKTELCPICKCYISKALFTLHYGRHRVCYTCTICQKQTAEITEMRTHLRKHYDQVEESNDKYCGICYTQFKSNHNLLVHNNLRHGGPKPVKKPDTNERQYKCPDLKCDAKFILSSLLKQHISLVHEQITDYICSICNKMLSSEISLKKHTAKYHRKKNKAE